MLESRRIEMERLIRESEEPLTGTALAKRFGVSRQVIVQDIAVMRAAGIQIVGTSSGYFIPKIKERWLVKTFLSRHHSVEEIEEELRIVVDSGGRNLNIMVEHPVYGEIVVSLVIGSRDDLKRFMEKVRLSSAVPLSRLTEGEHHHTIEVPNEAVYRNIEARLAEKGFIR